MGASGSKSPDNAPADDSNQSTSPGFFSRIFGKKEEPSKTPLSTNPPAPGTVAPGTLGGRRRFRKVKTHRRKRHSKKGRTGRKSIRS
jgi:hypothetical protein